MTPPALAAARKGSALIVYATTEGHTAKIAHFVADLMSQRGITVDLYNAADLPKRFSGAGYDRIFLAGSVHAGRYQEALAKFVNRHAEALNKTHSLFISVSLTAAGDKDEQKDALSLAWKFVSGADWKPTVVLSIAGALRFSQYDFFRRWMVKRVADDRGLKVAGKDDIEFTDWKALERAVVRFVSGI